MKKIIAVLFFLFLLIPHPALAAGAATFSLTPISASKQVNNVFTVEVRINTAGVAVNTMKAYLTFEPSVLEVTSISNAGSVAAFFTENDIDNVNGTIHITGAAVGSGYTGSNGLVVTLNIKAKGSGTSTLTFTSDSKIFSNVDNSDILDFAGLKNGSYTVAGTATGTGATTPVASIGAQVSSSSALPESGIFSNTATLIGLGFILIFAGVILGNPYLLTPKKWKKNLEKKIINKL